MNPTTGLKDTQIQFIISKIKQCLYPDQSIQIYVFGSRARGDYKTYSDLDLLLEGNPPLDNKQLSQLKDLFEESDLPIKVDIVTPENLLDSFKESVLRDKKILA